MQRRLIGIPVWLTTFLLLATPLLTGAPTRDHDIEPEDYFDIGTVTACAISPNGAMIAYTEMRWGTDKQRRTTDLWVVDVATKARRRLTFDRVGARSLAWSPDSSQIYFLGRYTRAGEENPPYHGKTQLWRMSPQGGEPFPITRGDDGVDSYVLSKDGKTLLFTKTDKYHEDDWKGPSEEVQPIWNTDGVPPICHKSGRSIWWRGGRRSSSTTSASCVT